MLRPDTNSDISAEFFGNDPSQRDRLITDLYSSTILFEDRWHQIDRLTSKETGNELI